VSTALAIVIAAVALACLLHMLWRARQGRRACCAPAADDAAAAVGARQRALAERIESLGGSATPRECAPERH
jgi:hypothetical protein